jgi:hypothetical protein
VSGDASVSDTASVSGDARVFGDDWRLSPLQIQGTRFFVCMATKKILAIGCEEHKLSDWPKIGMKLAKREGFSKDQVAEYRAYIKLAQQLYGPKRKASAKRKAARK